MMETVSNAVLDFINWLDRYGETSQDHQDFYAGNFSRRAKELYYRRPIIGKLAVLPMVFCEAFVPRARALFHTRMRLPIADAHYAMGFALLFMVTKNEQYYEKAVHFLEVLKQTRCLGYTHYAWGYPFDWQTRGGIVKAGTPLITTTPYCYEAFDYVYQIDGRQEWLDIMYSISEHVLNDYGDQPFGNEATSCTYTPLGEEGVVNASAYRSFLLTKAWKEFNKEIYWETAERNLNFVLQTQKKDGSWPYAVDGVRDFIDHFHTCFVLKALAKIDNIIDHQRTKEAIRRGVQFYLSNLFDAKNLPIPFARAPRLLIYKRELYDYAECLNLATLLGQYFPGLGEIRKCVLEDLLRRWRKPDGSFRSRRLLLGWDNVPMHRWGQAMIFRSLCLILYSEGSKKVL